MSGVALRGVLRAARHHIHHRVWALAWLRLRLLDVSSPWLRLLAILLAGGPSGHLLLPRLRLLLLLLLLLLEQLLLLQVLLLLLVGEVLGGVLRVLVVVGRVLHHLLVDVAEVFEDVDQLRPLLLHVGLVRVPDKVHVDAAVASRALPPLRLISFVVERVFLIEVVEVLVADLTRD